MVVVIPVPITDTAGLSLVMVQMPEGKLFKVIHLVSLLHNGWDRIAFVIKLQGLHTTTSVVGDGVIVGLVVVQPEQVVAAIELKNSGFVTATPDPLAVGIPEFITFKVQIPLWTLMAEESLVYIEL